jgi:DNA repair protein RadA/Sms
MNVEHSCKACDKAVSKWLPSCPHCSSFGTVVAGKPVGSSNGNRWIGSGQKPRLLSDVPIQDYERISTGTREFDRVLGGGIVTGSVVLISGDPGIGKSTILLQVAVDLSTAPMTEESISEDGQQETKPSEPLVILYVAAEETDSQIKGRAVRLSKESNRLYIYNECDVHEIAKQIVELDPDVLIVDSIQTMVMPGVDGAAGTVTQVRECALFIIDICRKRGIACFVVAHINKEGVVAGPKVLEHLVDATLEFHKEGQGELRSIRANKNRFGDTNEMALFRMAKDGLHSIENPSELLLQNHKDGKAGACLGIVSSGPRPLAVEFQTLLGAPSVNGSSAADRQHRRVFTGLSSQRATQVIAILQRRIGLDLNRECFVNVPGGLEEIKDPALDLPLALALASFALDVALPKSFIAFGEIGLVGEVRPVSFIEARIRAAVVMGYEMVMGPVQPSYETTDIVAALTQSDDEVDLKERYYPVASLEDAFDLLEGFVIEPHEPKQSKMKKDRRKRNPLSLVPPDGHGFKD